MSIESIDITITRVIWHGPAKWDPAGSKRVIARISSGQTIMGKMDRPALDSPCRLWGVWRLQKPFRGNPPENAFEFISYEWMVDRSEAGIVQYLRNHVDGLGPRLASRLVDEFGDDTLDVLRKEPDKALAVKGITASQVEKIRDHFDNQSEFDPAAYAKLVDLFSSAEVKIAQKTILKLLEFWGSDAPAKVVESPYLLLALPRMGWKTVDGFAQSPPVGYDARGLARQRAAILESLERISDEGHTYADRVDVEAGAFKLLRYCPETGAWEGLIERGMLWIDDSGPAPIYALPAMARAEEEIAEQLMVLAEQARPLGFELTSTRLNYDQQAALKVIEDNGVSLLIGPPGVGKSFATAAIVERLLARALSSICVVAPTGKAAKRAKELIDQAVPFNDIPCTTIHKALGLVPSDEESGIPSDDARVGRGRSGFRFEHRCDNPLEVDYLIVDECSMVDVSLMASLLAACPPGCRVLFVGDQNQLPSVGPGSVLRDMIAAGIPTSMLTKIVRSDGGGRIVRACHAIKDGRTPEPAEAPPRLPTENWVHIEESDPARIAEIIAGLCKPWAAFPDPVWDIQVVSAQHNKHGFGCNNLNSLLSRKLNPRDEGGGGSNGNSNGTPLQETDGDAFEPVFVIGDKVIRRKNGLADQMVPVREGSRDYASWTWSDQSYGFRSTDVVNGDMGTVKDIVMDGKKSWVVVRFRTPDRLCRLPYGDCHLQRAYAITVHSCVHPDTLVETEEGLLPIKEIAESGTIATPFGPQLYHNFVSNPEGPALKITVEDSYSVTVTPEHKVELWRSGQYEMVEANDVTEGDWMRLKLGVIIEPKGLCPLPQLPDGNVRAAIYRVPEFVTEDVAEFFGLMVADGTVFRTGFRLIKRHNDVNQKFADHCRSLFGAEPKQVDHFGTFGNEVSSTLMARWLLSLGGMSPHAKDVPDCILRSGINIQKAFLRGLFEDGGSQLRRGEHLDHIEWSSIYPSLIQKVKTILLRAGIISGAVSSRPNGVYLYGSQAAKFAKDIGFIAKFKQDMAVTAIDTEKRYRIPLSKLEVLPLRKFLGSKSFTLAVYQHALQRGYLSREMAKTLVNEAILPDEFLGSLSESLGYHHVRVTGIEPCVAPSMCVEVPNGHRFIQNGFPHGNSQGSGFPIVIVPVHASFYWDTRTNTGLWCRELLYTAISRAEQVLITVGTFESIRLAVGRKMVNRRRTRLTQLIREYTSNDNNPRGECYSEISVEDHVYKL